MLPGLGDGGSTPGRTQSLYRKYRPTSFESDDLVGQEHVARTLRNALARGRVAHAYLFCGPRGTGKTSTARLLAKAVNCLNNDPEQRPCNDCEACRAINSGSATDIIEIDAASNRGIDDMRDLRERVNYAPAQLRTKFYIIDEAHQITKDAFNALLKTLEEPPPNTTFILATTDPDKLPETISSRCQRFDFRRIPKDKAVAHMRNVAEREGIAIDDDVLELIARRATGSLRDALSLVDMLATAAGETEGGRIDLALARRMLGLTDDGWEYDLVRALAAQDIPAGLTVIANVVDAGHDTRAFGKRVLELLRLLMLLRAGADPVEATDAARELAPRFELPQLLRINRQFADIDFKIRHGSFPQLPLELAFVGSLVEPGAATGSAEPARAIGAAPAVQREPRPVRERPNMRAESRQFDVDQPAVRPAERTAERPAPSRERREPATPPPPTPPAISAQAGSAGDGDLLGTIARGWDRIRTEVKIVDRKVEALLASTDPGRVTGDALFIVAHYPFHAQKLNEERVRGIVEDAVEKVAGRRLRATFVLKDNLPGQTAGAAPARGNMPPAAAQPFRPANGVHEDEPPFDDGPEPPEETFFRSARAIMDGEDILDPDEIARIP